MGGFVTGDIVIVPFPFSDLTGAKRRPALVVAELSGADGILAEITSQPHHDGYSIPLTAAGFAEGGLPHDSFIRINRLFTADAAIVIRRAGRLRADRMAVVSCRLRDLFA